MICKRCGGSGTELYDDTDARGYLCTSSRPCPRCSRSTQWGIVAVLAVVLGLLPAVLTLWWGQR